MPNVKAQHPLYADKYDDWVLLANAYAGERRIKDQNTTYLPATGGMVADGMANQASPGYQAYLAYKSRARFPEVVKPAVRTMVGVMHRKPAVIELPKKLEPFLERCTVNGEDILGLLRRINEQQIMAGRFGLWLDLPEVVEDKFTLPYVATYGATSIINWDDGSRSNPAFQNLNLVVVDETASERGVGTDPFEWTEVSRHRALILGDPTENEGVDAGAAYRVWTFKEEQLIDQTVPVWLGKPLDFIPFVFVNSSDLLPDPSEPPLLGLANLALSMYRQEADYRQALFMQGQDTLVTIGANIEAGHKWRLGGGASIDLPLMGDAKFIGVDGAGLPEMRAALENDSKIASVMSGQLVDTTSRERESGDALQTRVAAQTATINQVAQAGAAGLQRILRMAATWVGADPSKVVIRPNMQFSESRVTPRALVEFATAKSMGIPISETSIHAWMKRHGLTELDLDAELEAIEQEEPKVDNPDHPGGGNPEFLFNDDSGDRKREAREDDPSKANNTNSAE